MIPVAVHGNTSMTVDVAALSASKRFGFWSEVICKNFSPAENVTTLPKEKFRAKLKGRALGNLGISIVSSSPMTSERTYHSLRRDPLDCFFVSLLMSGSAQLTQNGRHCIQRAGDYVMYDSAQPFTYDMTSEYEGVWLRLPRQTVVTRMAHPEALTARSSPSSRILGHLVRLTLMQASEIELASNSAAAARIASSIVDILAAAFELDGFYADQENPRHVNLLDCAKSYILANIDNPDLDTDILIKSVGVSRRTLNRMFAQEGTTPIRWLWQQRLHRAKEMLQGGSHTKVTDVALNTGFTDFSHFSRAFKSEFGISPSDLLTRKRN